MAWTTMHFAVGMAGAGAIGFAGCAISRKGWRWLPAVMTLGGMWANIPDMPRFWREDFPWLPFHETLGQRSLETWLHERGDLFFFHHWLDAPPHNAYALHGLILMIIFYNLAIALLMWLEHRQRHGVGNRAWQAHTAAVEAPRMRLAETAAPRDVLDELVEPRAPGGRSQESGDRRQESGGRGQATEVGPSSQPDVVKRIGPDHLPRTG